MLTDYHTHTPLCRHAEGTAQEMAQAAENQGLAEFGVSDHNPMPEAFDDWRMDWAEFPIYLDFVQEVAQALSIPVRLGLECDFIPGREAWLEQVIALADWDYLIGAVHYLAPDWEVDHPKYLSRWQGVGAVEQIWQRYWELYEQNIRCGLFDWVAHPDLPKKFGFRPAGDLRSYYEPSIIALAETGTVMEVNTAGLRKDVQEIYPSREMLQMAFDAGVEIVINSDAHAPGEVAAGFAEALNLVQSVGYTHTVRFAKRCKQRVPLPLTWPC